MSDTRPLIPVWYVGDGVTEPTRTFIHEGAEYPESDTDGRTLNDAHHFTRWTDARDQQLVDARAGLSMDTRDLVNAEGHVRRCQVTVATTAKELHAIQRLKEPTE